MPEIFLSVLMTFNEGKNAGNIVNKIKTQVKINGNCAIDFTEIKVDISSGGKWKVLRK